MTFRPMGEEFTKAEEDQLAPPGSYLMEIKSLEEYSQEGGREGVKFTFGFVEDDYPPVNVWLDWPPEAPLVRKKDGQTQNQLQFEQTKKINGREWRKAAEQFNVTFDLKDGGLDPEDFIGQQAEVEVVRDRNGQYNTVRFQRLDVEEQQTEGRGRGRNRQEADEDEAPNREVATQPRTRRRRAAA